MGHHLEQNSTHNHREALLIQRRIVSFLLAFSVLAVAFVVLVSSIQTRESDCQIRANVALYSVYAKSGEGNNTLIGTIAAALKENNMHVESKEKENLNLVKELNLFDTAEKTLQNSGFRLVRQTGGNNVIWQLRYLSQDLCKIDRKISMEALPNVDYERVSYNVKAVNANSGRAFLFQVNVATKDPDRIKTFPQLQSLFSGFNAQVASPRMLITKSFKNEIIFSGDIYYGFNPMDVQMEVEEWKKLDDGTTFWRIVIYTNNILAERNLKATYKVISNALRSKSDLCDRESCGGLFDDAFLQ